MPFSRILSKDLPGSVDQGLRFTGWKMLGNDIVGDCVAVAWANQRALVTTVLAGKTEYPDQAQVFELYRTQNEDFDPYGEPSQNGPGSRHDKGMDIQKTLDHLHKEGGPDGVRVVAFAKVNHRSPEEVRAAHAIFGQVLYGVRVTDWNVMEFSFGQPWTTFGAGWKSTLGVLEPGTEHCVTGVGYGPDDYRLITWATETEWDETFRSDQVDEAWVVIWPEHFGAKEFLPGLDLEELKAEYLKLTGDPLDPSRSPH